jgi:hypothetical protein
MQQRSTFIPVQYSVVLAIGCAGALLARCRAAAARFSLGVETGDLLSIIEMAASLRPIALLVDADIYGFDPGEFDALALSVGARCILIDDEEPLDQLVERLGRLMTASGPAVAKDGPTPSRRGSPRSGIRWASAARNRQAA